MEDGDEILSQYSRDASLLSVRPQVVVFPMDSLDVQSLVKWVSENCTRQDLVHKYGKLSITARCAGTDMSGGAIGESIIMDFTRHMNELVGGPLPIDSERSRKGRTNGAGAGKKFGNYPLVPSYITVQPGMFYRDFEKITLEKGLILPCYTASKSINAMGGMFGNNSAGERTLKYGKMEDYILESKVVFADGVERIVKPLSKTVFDSKMSQGDAEAEIYRKIFDLIKQNEDEIKQAKPKVNKNSAGYYLWNLIDQKNSKNFSGLLQPSAGTFPVQNSMNSFDLNKLLVGSQGTLGIVTEMTLKIIPNNKYSKLVAIFMNDLSPLGRLVDEILELKPETLEAYDDKTMKLAVRFFPDFLKNKGFFGILKMGWSFLPESQKTLYF